MMRISTSIVRGFMIFVLLQLLGCMPTSQYPLSSPAESIMDKNLLGRWVPMDKEILDEDEQENAVVLIKERLPNLHQITIISKECPKDKPCYTKTDNIFGLVTALKQENTMNYFISAKECKLQTLEQCEKNFMQINDEEPFYIFLYTVKDDVLTLYELNESFINGAILGEKIQGEPSNSSHGFSSDPKLIATTEALRKFFQSSGLFDLFEEEPVVQLKKQ